VTDSQTTASLLNKENKAHSNSAAFRKVQKLPLQERLDEPITLMAVAPRFQKTSVISPAPTKEHEDIRQPSHKTIEDLYAYDDGNVSLSEDEDEDDNKGVAVQGMRDRDDNGKEFYDMLADVINRSKQVIDMG
jgi:hypothetical protein